jgi:hypothetical protein
MAGAWFHPESVLSLCQHALEEAVKARRERFFRLTKEDAAPPSWWPWKGKAATDEELTKRYDWVWSDDTSNLCMAHLILRGWVHGPYWHVEDKVKRLTQLAQLKGSVNNGLNKMDDDSRKLTIGQFLLETPGCGIYLTDEELEELDLQLPLGVHFPNELKAS